MQKSSEALYESEALDESSDYDEHIPQPETYPNVQSTPRPLPKLSRRVSSCDEFLLINPATANDLPKREYIAANNNAIIIIILNFNN